VIDITARLVIVALVEDERITCRKGWNRAVASKVAMFLHVARSLLSFAKADSKGLSWMLLPRFPLRPHLLANVVSSSAWEAIEAILLLPPTGSIRGVPALELARRASPWSGTSRELREAPPPKMAETELCAHRACLRMAEVRVIHSCVTRATGSMRMPICCRGCGSLVVYAVVSVNCGREGTVDEP